MTVPTMTNTVHYLTIDNVQPGQLPVSLAISITLSGCKEESFSEGAMMVNSINTASLCGQANRRPLKILFQPSAGQAPLDTCGPEHLLTRRNSDKLIKPTPAMVFSKFRLFIVLFVLCRLRRSPHQ